MSATIRCWCADCNGRAYAEITEYLDVHPHDHHFLVELDDRPYQASPKNVQQMFQWDRPL
jgi:hypothetical protein